MFLPTVQNSLNEISYDEFLTLKTETDSWSFLGPLSEMNLYRCCVVHTDDKESDEKRKKKRKKKKERKKERKKEKKKRWSSHRAPIYRRSVVIRVVAREIYTMGTENIPIKSTLAYSENAGREHTYTYIRVCMCTDNR